PFAKERYWVPIAGKHERFTDASAKEVLSTAAVKIFDETFYSKIFDEISADSMSIDEALEKVDEQFQVEN
ncbi:hypothetical protein, partial [Bradyrhizobium nitroreducens]|uniref:hypothetical protein n=1 Tax=Bradyrhizobium nitroreducens TaxID=709803 RepID=UPI001AEFB722